MSSHQPRAHNYATLKTSSGCYRNKEDYRYNHQSVKENFGSFSLSSSIRMPYNYCRGKRNCQIVNIPGLT